MCNVLIIIMVLFFLILMLMFKKSMSMNMLIHVTIKFVTYFYQFQVHNIKYFIFLLPVEDKNNRKFNLLKIYRKNLFLNTLIL